MVLNFNYYEHRALWQKSKEIYSIAARIGYKLYWCEEPRQIKDWFIIAVSKRTAQAFFNREYQLGYTIQQLDRITAFPVMFIENHLLLKVAKRTSRATSEQLIKLGIKLITDDVPRIAYFNNIIFQEGDMDVERINTFLLLEELKKRGIISS